MRFTQTVWLTALLLMVGCGNAFESEPPEPSLSANDDDMSAAVARPAVRQDAELAAHTEVPKTCAAAGATQAELVSKTIANGTAGSFVEYRVFRTDCQGALMALGEGALSFDFDAHATAQEPALPFTVTIGGATLRGQMNHLVGSDLFGHVGNTWGHYETDRRLELKDATSFRLRIELLGRAFREPATKGAPAGAPTPLLLAMPTYLRFADAVTIQRVVPTPAAARAASAGSAASRPGPT